MSRFTFEVVPHPIRKDSQVVKILLDGAVCGRIFESERHLRMLRIVSDFIEGDAKDGSLPSGVTMKPATRTTPSYPHLCIRFAERQTS
jgi:hypothetical protein